MDGVTLMANAIRKEEEERLKKVSKEMSSSGNVADATAQFSNKSRGKTEQKTDTPAKNEPPAKTPEGTDETDNTGVSEGNENNENE